VGVNVDFKHKKVASSANTYLCASGPERSIVEQWNYFGFYNTVKVGSFSPKKL